MRARIPALNPADGLNINRMFPGDAGGSASQRTAAWLMELQSESDFYIDMHGGDVHEKLSPYVYIPGACEERVTAAARRAAAFVNVPVRILSSALSGAYNSAAACGTPSILIERGQGGRWSEAEVTEYRADILSVLAHLGTVDGANFAGVHALSDRRRCAPSTKRPRAASGTRASSPANGSHKARSSAKCSTSRDASFAR